jgi:hypothetical protein
MENPRFTIYFTLPSDAVERKNKRNPMNADPDLAPASDLVITLTTEVKILLQFRFATFCNILKQVYFC